MSEGKVQGKNKGGRPTIMTPEMIDKIVTRMQFSAKGLARLCDEDPELPHHSTVWDHLDKNPAFSAKVQRAKEIQAEFLAYNAFDILDSVDLELVEGSKTSATVNLARARADARIKLIPKIAPRTMGDRHAVEMSGKVDTAPQDTSPPSDELVKAAHESMQGGAE